MKQEKEIGTPFSVLIHVLDPEKGITTRDYFDALDCQVKTPLHVAYIELAEAIADLPDGERERADNFLQIQRAAFMLWEQIDKKVMEYYKQRNLKGDDDYILKERDKWKERSEAAEKERLSALRRLSYFISEEAAGRLHIDPIPKGANLAGLKTALIKDGSKGKK